MARERPFLVGVANLSKTGPRRERREGRSGDLEVSGSAVPAGAAVVADVLIEPVHGGIMASGTVSAPWEGECRRCLGPAVGRLEVEVRELYESRSDGVETYSLTGDQLDLEPLARDAVLLELPQAPLCSEGCQGLCPTCGANLNDGPCGCEPDRTPD